MLQDDNADDVPQLSAETFAALQEFYLEQEQKQLKAAAASDDVPFDENWQLSQFWYDDDTVAALVDTTLRSVCSGHKSPIKIGLVSCPTLYKRMKTRCDPATTSVHVLEYDRRFTAFGEDYIFYDYNQPLSFSKSIEEGCYDVVIADPPFLSEECLSKVLETIRFLTKGKVIVCTGEKMAEFLLSNRPDLRRCVFKPRHANNLANEFSCFANFDFDAYLSN